MVQNTTSFSVSDAYTYVQKGSGNEIMNIQTCRMAGRNDAVFSAIITLFSGNADMNTVVFDANGTVESGFPTPDTQIEGTKQNGCYCNPDGSTCVGVYPDADNLFLDWVNYSIQDKSWSTSTLATTFTTENFASDDITFMEITDCPDGNCVMISWGSLNGLGGTGVFWNGTNFSTTYAVEFANVTTSTNINKPFTFMFKPNTTVPTVEAPTGDTISPIINGTLNKSLSNILQNDIINATFNATDEINLTNGTIVINKTGIKEYFNFSLNGSALITLQFSQNFTISESAGTVINITGIAIDNSSNRKQNETIFTVSSGADTTFPIVNTSFNSSTPNNLMSVFNFTANITDETGLSTANWTVNFTNGTVKMNYTVSGTSAQVSNTTSFVGFIGGSVFNFTLFVTDTSNNVKQNSTTFTLSDVITPIVNTSYNTSLTPNLYTIINFTANLSDETGLSTANITYNISGFLTKINFTVSGTSAQIYNVTAFNVAGVFNITAYVTDTSNNVKQNSTIFIVVDNVFPIVNTSFNVSGALITSVINYTANITDETGLLSANWTVNLSTGKIFANYTISGTTAQISNTTSLSSCTETCVLNFTIYATDTSNNVKQNSTLLTVADVTLPVVNTTFNNSNPLVTDTINYTANITDLNGLLSANWTVNLSTGKIFANYTISGNSAQISNTTSLSSCTETCVLNFTIYATDIKNNVKQNSTLLVIADTTFPVVNTTTNISNPNINDIINFTGNITDLNGLLSANITYNMSGILTKINFTLNGVTSTQISNATRLEGVGGSVINFTLYATDNANNVKQNSTLITITDNVFPIVNASFNLSSIKINDVLNFSCNITDETGLLFGNLTNNQSGTLIKSNYTLSGTRAEISNTTNITSSRGSLINFTCYGTDTSNNVKQNSTLIIVADTLGSIFIGINNPSPKLNDVINISGNATDIDNDFSLGVISYNVSGNPQLNFSFVISGTKGNFSQNITINSTRGNVINFTVFYNDTAGTIVQNSTLITVANTNVTISAFQPSITSFQINFTTNITFNITGSDNDNDELTLIWNVNNTFNISNQNLSYIFNRIGLFNITGNISDNFSIARRQWDVTVINDTQEAVGEEGRKVSGGGDVITSSITILMPFGLNPINGTCAEGFQLFDEKCYSCNPETGYLEFNPNDRSVICISCNEGHKLNENKTCIPIKKKVSNILQKTAIDIGKSILPNNPRLGSSITIIFSLAILGLAIQFIINKDKEKVRKDLEESLEEEPDEEPKEL